MTRVRNASPGREAAAARRERPGTCARIRGRIGRAFALAAVVAAAVAPAFPSPAAAQPLDVAARCAIADVSEATRAVCNFVAQGVEMAQPRFGIAAVGGNPVPGTASTVGMRIGSTPRVSVALRTTGVWVRLPYVPDAARGASRRAIVPGVAVDGAIGLFQGFSPLPTIGGMGSLDLLASLGFISPPGATAVVNGRVGTAALGLRLGILRESFLAPGVSVTGMYRLIATTTAGDPSLAEGDASYRLSGNSVATVRAAVGKRLLGFGATVGVGYDRFGSDVRVAVRNPDPGPGEDAELRFDVRGVSSTRFTAFANASWTLMVLNLVGELGWQAGGERVPGEFPPGASVSPRRRGFYGSLAARLTI